MESAPPSLAPVTLLWIESTRPGTAARTHLDGSRERLDAAGITIGRLIASDAEGGGLSQRLRRLLRLVRDARAAADGGILVARWHPFLAFVSPRWIRRGGKVLLLVQGNDESGYEANPWLRGVPGIRRMMRRSVIESSWVLAVNEGLAQWVRELTVGEARRPIELISQGVNEVFFGAAPRPGLGEYVLFFGSLAPWQGIEYLLKAHASPEWPRGVRLLVIGSGAMQDTVEARQGPMLQWLGPKPPAEVAEYAAGALCTVCPKSDTPSMANTTTPFKILESIAAGVPVIATNIPAQATMLADGYGLLVSVDDPSDLARAVARLREDPGLRERLAAAARAVAPKYRWAGAAPQLLQVIRALQAG